MSDCQICAGSGWIIIERPDGVSGAKISDCRRIQKTSFAPGKTNLTPEAAAFIVEGLCENLAYAPKTEVGKAIITNALLSMCSTQEQAAWTVQRACMLYTKWSGCLLPGLRQIVCSKYPTKDGINLSHSEGYPEGIPPEHPPRRVPASPALSSGHVASVRQNVDTVVQEPEEAKWSPARTGRG